MFNKKGSMFTGNTIFVLVSIFGLGLLTLLIIGPAIQAYIAPALLSTTTGELNTMLSGKIDFILTMLKLVPYILFAIGIIYLLIIIFRKERVEYYG
jgi:hypothetical protein